MSTVAEKVAKGINFLQENQPGFEFRVDLDTLDQGDTGRCILSQAYGVRFSLAMEEAFPHYNNVQNTSEPYGFWWDSVGELNREWKKQITELRTKTITSKKTFFKTSDGRILEGEKAEVIRFIDLPVMSLFVSVSNADRTYLKTNFGVVRWLSNEDASRIHIYDAESVIKIGTVEVKNA